MFYQQFKISSRSDLACRFLPFVETIMLDILWHWMDDRDGKDSHVYYLQAFPLSDNSKWLYTEFVTNTVHWKYKPILHFSFHYFNFKAFRSQLQLRYTRGGTAFFSPLFEEKNPTFDKVKELYLSSSASLTNHHHLYRLSWYTHLILSCTEV